MNEKPRRRPVQKRLVFPRRPGRPRKRIEDRRGHRRRAEIDARYPLFVTVRFRDGLPSARQGAAAQVFYDELLKRQDPDVLRIVEVSLQRNHYHMIVEVPGGRERFARLLQGFHSALARRWNRLWNRRGAVVEAHRDERVLTNVASARNRVGYTVWNGWHHDVAGVDPDPCSSAPWSRAWARPLPDEYRPQEPSPFLPPATEVLRAVYRRPSLEPMRPYGSLNRWRRRRSA